MMCAFLAIETRSSHPMLPLSLFRNHAFTGVQNAAFSISATLFALSLYLTFYLQEFLGESPLVAGEHLFALTGVLFVFGAMSGSWVSSIPARIQIGVGSGLLGLGLILMSGLSLTDKWTALLPGLIVAGAGAGIVNTVIADVAVSGVPKEQSGLASGANDAFRNLGIAVGIAGWGALLTARGASRITTLLPAAHASARQLINAVSAGQLRAAVAALPAEVIRETIEDQPPIPEPLGSGFVAA